MRIIAFIILSTFAIALPAQSNVVEYNSEGHPVITFKNQTLDAGEINAGEEITLQYEFINSGTKDLNIEIVTACKCTSLSWPQEPVAPNAMGSIFVTFDSTGYEGEVDKVIDIISNTDPVVVEAFFKVNVVKAK